MVEDPPAESSLPALRAEIEQIDRAIVALLAARLDAAGAAIRLRSRLDGRIENPTQEARVLARARKWGATLGLPAAVTNTVFRTLIDEGKARFAAGPYGIRSSAGSSKNRWAASLVVPLRSSSRAVDRETPRRFASVAKDALRG